MSEIINLNPTDRTLLFNGTRLEMGVQNDEGLQEFTFICPIHIEDDVRSNQCQICIAYRNTKSGLSGVDDVEDFSVLDLENVRFVWRPQKQLFYFPGIVYITLWLIKFDGDDVVWSWHSKRAEGIIHPMSLNNSEGLTPSEFVRESILIPTGFTVTEVD